MYKAQKIQYLFVMHVLSVARETVINNECLQLFELNELIFLYYNYPRIPLLRLANWTVSYKDETAFVIVGKRANIATISVIST